MKRDRKRERELPSYVKLPRKWARGGGWREAKRRSVGGRMRREEGGRDRWNYAGTNCSYKFVRIHSRSSVREIWSQSRTKLVELILYRFVLFSLCISLSPVDLLRRARERIASMQVQKLHFKPIAVLSEKKRYYKLKGLAFYIAQ